MSHYIYLKASAKYILVLTCQFMHAGICALHICSEQLRKLHFPLECACTYHTHGSYNSPSFSSDTSTGNVSPPFEVPLTRRQTCLGHLRCSGTWLLTALTVMDGGYTSSITASFRAWRLYSVLNSTSLAETYITTNHTHILRVGLYTCHMRSASTHLVWTNCGCVPPPPPLHIQSAFDEVTNKPKLYIVNLLPILPVAL